MKKNENVKDKCRKIENKFYKKKKQYLIMHANEKTG